MNQTEHLEDDMKVLDSLVEVFRAEASHYDQKREFPHTNFDLLVEHKLHTVVLDPQFGGKGFGFEKTGKLLTHLASGCPSTALCFAMHLFTLASLAPVLSVEQREWLLQDIVNNGQFICSFNLTSVFFNRSFHNPTNITIEKVKRGYVVNGKKKYVSGIKHFKYIPVFGNQNFAEKKGIYGITALLVRKDDPGVKVVETWNSSGMRATLSHDIHFEQVFIPEERLIGREGFGVEDVSQDVYWSRLVISSVYLGIAKEALRYVTQLIKRKNDSISKVPLSHMPGIQYKYADLLIKYETAYNQLSMYSQEADLYYRSGSYPTHLFEKALMTKEYIATTANEIVWLAMQIEGMGALTPQSPLERLYRDVRAATFHFPADDFLKEILAKKSLGVLTLKQRWG